MGAARELVDRAAHGASEHTYGINTGFGRFVSKAIPPELTRELQLRLLRSHACGVGEPYPDEVVRAAMLLRANALAKGYSGARVETVELLLACLNGGLVPHVPSRGLGRGERRSRAARAPGPAARRRRRGVDRRRAGSEGGEALARVGLEPIELEAKEGLSLVNGTQFMAAMGALGLVRARRLADAADVACALSLEALQGSRTSFLPQVHALRPLRGQQASAANVLRLLDGSAIIEAHRWCDKVQDAYSLRCAPQVHGAVARPARLRRLHGLDGAQRRDRQPARARGGRHARLERQLPRPAARVRPRRAWRWRSPELASISERRVERLVNPNLSDGLPAFLTVDGGLNSGFMIPQYVAASLVSENKVLAHPASVDSIPTSAGQEDHVSMGNASGLKAWQVLANSERALAIELLAGAQGVEFLAPLEPGPGVAAARSFVRTLSPRLVEDRSLSVEIEHVATAIRDGSLLAAVEAEVGALR